MIRRVSKNFWKWVIGSLAILATLVSILANWEAAWKGLHRLLTL